MGDLSKHPFLGYRIPVRNPGFTSGLNLLDEFE